MKASQVAWLVSLAAFVSTALIGQAEMLAEPWRHIVSVVAIIATAISGFMVQHPWSGDERRQDTGPSYFVVRDGVAHQTTREGFERVMQAVGDDKRNDMALPSKSASWTTSTVGKSA